MTIRNTVFEQNYAVGMESDYRSGGGALNADVETQQGGVNTLNVVNTLFVDNISGGNGGAIVLLGMDKYR